LLAKNADGSVLMRVEAPVYRNLDSDSETLAPFGPLLRIQRGGWYAVNLKNNLEPQPFGNHTTEAEAGMSNFHVHGLHVSGGVPSTDTATTYLGGDNIFIKLSKGESNLYRATIPNDHLPGVHWYHPHFEPASSIQTFASHGPIIVDDDDAWLPDSNGCSAVKDVVNSADRKVMLFTRYPFMDITDYANTDDVVTAWDDNPNYQLVAEQANVTYCCDEPGENDDRPVEDQQGTLSGTAIKGTTGEDLVFLNGGYQPTLSMSTGVWQRWSMVMASFNGALLMQVIDPATGEATDACDVLKLSSDGLWAMTIPRPVTYMLIPSGGRGEVLIRCNTAGTYDLVTTSVGTPVGPGIEGDTNFATQKLVTLDVGEGGNGGPSDDLKANECTPLRPYYAADLRDPALKAQGVTAKYDPVPDFTGTPPSIGCSMSNEKFSMMQTPYELPIGEVTEWRFARVAFHPLHVHINPFQMIRVPEAREMRANTSMEGGWYEAGDFFDTFYLPQLGFNSTDPIRLPLRSNPGPYFGESVTHCHFLNHEDSGCMHMIKYTCPNGTVQEQYPYRCSTTTAVHGTFEGGPGSTDPSSSAAAVICTSITTEDECLARNCPWNDAQSVCNDPDRPAAGAAGLWTLWTLASVAASALAWMLV
jgi:FtsP/CotA-like multicopper oxidase with cupredoxin domain